MCVCVCVCVCARARTCMCMCACVRACMCVREGKREWMDGQICSLQIACIPQVWDSPAVGNFSQV